MRTCAMCKKSLPLSAFNKCGELRLQAYCRGCQSEYGRLARKKHQQCELQLEYRCSGCGFIKLWTEFYRAKTARGVSVYCKGCQSAIGKRYYAANREHHHEIVLRWMHEHPQQVAAHRAKHRASETYAQTVKEYCAKNRDKIRAQSQNWYRSNSDKAVAKIHRRRSRLKSAGAFSAAEWRALLRFWRNRCVCCGITGEKTKLGRLTPDHVIPLSAGGSNTIDNIQPLCMPCNKSKAVKAIDYRIKQRAQIAIEVA